MRNTQYAASATAGVLNTQIKRKIRSLLIRSVNRIAQLSLRGLAGLSTTTPVTITMLEV